MPNAADEGNSPLQVERRSRERRVSMQATPQERRRSDRRRPGRRAGTSGPAGDAAVLGPPFAVVAGRRAPPRPRVAGKFLFVGDETFWVRGVTYGTFRPNAAGQEFHDRDAVERDFWRMAASGVNTVRTYTVPPRWLLDAAERHGLRVMVGLPWEQHVAFLDDPARVRSIERRVRDWVWACSGHPAVLCYTVGNEIPSPIVRWHGRRRVQRFIERLYRAAKREDPHALVTYVNYPSTEYLELPFIDFLCFNVYLESRARLAAYLARLQNLAGDRPLVMAEIGLDSRRHGEEGQALSLDWQVRTAFASGCAGAFVFAWTDEWHRGGYDVDDWDFGLTERARRPKPALAVVSQAFADVPFAKSQPWPRISVVVCTYNGARTIQDCFDGLLQLEYPNFEVIVVNDGSSDRTAAIAREYGFRLTSTENHGLSCARNTGWQMATGEIVAYIDDDAYPDPHWLTYLAATFLDTHHVGVGGPNIPPPGDGPIAECVANAPGGPLHVLLSDTEAEHIPGCNMAFRKSALEAIGGFDTRFRTAGDDVDISWRLQERGWTIGFQPAAVVWHHRRNSVLAYWRQQQGYGRAEALLERKWPERYNAAGHITWTGRLYGRGSTEALRFRRGRIYHGTWGSAPFQRLYETSPGTLRSLPLMPEWYLVILALAVLGAIGVVWRPLLLAIPLLGLAFAACVTQALLTALRTPLGSTPRSTAARIGGRALTTLLHLLQPAARLKGRLGHGLTPWRWQAAGPLGVPRTRTQIAWRETWRSPAETLQALERQLRDRGAGVRRGGDFDRWDLEVRGGLLGSARLFMAIEEHGAGKQLLRFRSWPRLAPGGLALTLTLAALAILAGLDRAWTGASVLGALAALVGLRTLAEAAAGSRTLAAALTDAGARDV